MMMQTAAWHIGLVTAGVLTASAAVAANPDHIQQLKQTGSCQNCDLSHADLRNLELENADLSRANLSHANLSNALFFGTSLGDIKPASLNSNYTDIFAVRREVQHGIDQMHAKFQTQATRVIELGGRSAVGYILRAQQAFYLEHKRFALDVDERQVDINRFSPNYRFKLFALKAPQSDAWSLEHNRAVWIAARPHQPQWQSYIGLVWRGLAIPAVSFGKDQVKTAQPFSFSILCQSNQPLAQAPSPPRLNNQGLHRRDAMCPQGYSLVK